MKRPRLTQRRLLSAVAVVLLVLSFLPARWGHRIAAAPHWLVSIFVAPPGSVLSSIGHTLRPGPKLQLTDRSFDQLQQDYGQALTYNRQLEQQNARLRKQIARLTQSSQRIGLAGIRMIDARVTALSPGDANPILTIDHGSRSGIAKGMAVVSGFNLVGRVIAASHLTAEVALITTPGQGLSVRIVPPTPNAPPRQMTAWITWKKDAAAFVFNPGIDKPVQKDDLVHLDDDTWPREAGGFVVGKVTRIEKHPTDPLNLKRVIIEPMVSLPNLDRVTVLVPKD